MARASDFRQSKLSEGEVEDLRSENHMHCFIGRWPTPEGISHPDQ